MARCLQYFTNHLIINLPIEQDDWWQQTANKHLTLIKLIEVPGY
jgi:hypothetical protein